ncbi:hypothetical protein BC826DRAFT_132252 [Russula brevipes]|nr:hypothetical protein BC826DRAFT_132252 [Russula brevipes]
MGSALASKTGFVHGRRQNAVVEGISRSPMAKRVTIICTRYKREKRHKRRDEKERRKRAAANSGKVTKLEGLYVAALAGELFITASSSAVERCQSQTYVFGTPSNNLLFREDNEHETDSDILSWSFLWPSFRPFPKNNAQFASLIVGLNTSSG